MKTFILFTFLIASVSVRCQSVLERLPRNPETQKVEYVEIVEVPQATKATLFAKAQTWMATTFRSANQTIQLADKETGTLIAKGTMPTRVRAMGRDYPAGVFRLTMAVQVKDGKYKVTLSEIVHEGDINPNGAATMGPIENSAKASMIRYPTRKQWDELRANFHDDALKFLAKFKETMQKPNDDF